MEIRRECNNCSLTYRDSNGALFCLIEIVETEKILIVYLREEKEGEFV